MQEDLVNLSELFLFEEKLKATCVHMLDLHYYDELSLSYPGACIIKLSRSQLIPYCNKLECLSFHPSLMKG
jgi:hypothetical protein